MSAARRRKDTIPPTAPSGLSATPGGQQISLAWNASTDTIGVAGYYIYRNNNRVATTTGTAYTDTGLSDGSAYSYYVRAYDTSGNVSAASNIASATPLDTNPPTAPKLTGSAGDAKVSLSWSGATDNLGVAGYDIYRNGSEIAQTTSTSYTDSGRTDGISYNYYVMAYDAAGNVSAPSNSVSETPTAATPTTDPSGVAMPQGNLPGWQQTYAEDFATAAPIGSWNSSGSSTIYPDVHCYADGWHGTPSTGTYEPFYSVFAGNGLLAYALGPQTINGTAYNVIDACEPKISGSSVVGSAGGQLYGKYVVRARWDGLYGYHVSFLLWPDSGTWPADGEIDWPEGEFDGSKIAAFEHWQGGTTGGSQYSWVVSGLNESSWHTYEIDWTRSYVAFYLDGALVGESTDTSKIPDTPMHWVMQTGLSNSETNLSLLGIGHLQVAWAVAYSPCGSC